ncbi:hypothetical protein ACLB2K_007142 [Fragaria x ananassa]
MKKLSKTLDGKLPQGIEEEDFVEMDRMALGALSLLNAGSHQQVGIVGDIIEQLASVDVNFNEHIKVLVLLTSMPPDWDMIVNSICRGAGTTKKLKFDDVYDVLLNEETRRLNNHEDPSSSALSMENRGRTFVKIHLEFHPETRSKSCRIHLQGKFTQN